MITTVRRVLILLVGTAGIAMATTAPALALSGMNHTEPFNQN